VQIKASEKMATVCKITLATFRITIVNLTVWQDSQQP